MERISIVNICKYLRAAREISFVLIVLPSRNKVFIIIMKWSPLCHVTVILGNHTRARELWVKWRPPLACLLSKLQPKQTSMVELWGPKQGYPCSAG